MNSINITEFEKELRERELLFNEQKKSAVQLAKADTEKNMKSDLDKKENEIMQLKMKIMH